MFSLLSLAVLAPLLASAIIVPTAPDSTTVANAGATCHIQWTPDTTGKWTTTYIELMSGSNLDMVHLTTVGTVDGTSATNTSLDWTCPAVTPNAKIYFYQFTSPDDPTNTTWTTRFTIADANGNTVAPSQTTQPGGAPTPWGVGALNNPADATPPPPTGGGSSAAAAPTNSSVQSNLPLSTKSLVTGSSSGSATPTATSTTTGASSGGVSSTYSSTPFLMAGAAVFGFVAVLL